MKIRAAVLTAMGVERPYTRSKPLRVEELHLQAPQEGEVLIRMRAAGVCHSDLSVVDGNRPRPLPMALGHEGTGVVEQLGPGVENLAVGDHVVTVFLPRCGACQPCQTNGKLPCARGMASNNAGHLPGSSEGHGEKIGADIPAEVAAPLGCAVLTGGGAVMNAGNPQDGESVMVIGLGGVGSAALLTAIGLGKGKVIGVDAREDKLTRAAELGATAVYTPEQVTQSGKTITVGLPSPAALSTIHPLVLTTEARTVIGSYLGSAVPISHGMKNCGGEESCP